LNFSVLPILGRVFRIYRGCYSGTVSFCVLPILGLVFRIYRGWCSVPCPRLTAWQNTQKAACIAAFCNIGMSVLDLSWIVQGNKVHNILLNTPTTTINQISIIAYFLSLVFNRIFIDDIFKIPYRIAFPSVKEWEIFVKLKVINET